MALECREALLGRATRQVYGFPCLRLPGKLHRTVPRRPEWSAFYLTPAPWKGLLELSRPLLVGWLYLAGECSISLPLPAGWQCMLQGSLRVSDSLLERELNVYFHYSYLLCLMLVLLERGNEVAASSLWQGDACDQPWILRSITLRRDKSQLRKPYCGVLGCWNQVFPRLNG